MNDSKLKMPTCHAVHPADFQGLKRCSRCGLGAFRSFSLQRNHAAIRWLQACAAILGALSTLFHISVSLFVIN